MKHYIVHYEFITGEYGIPKSRVVDVADNKTLEEALDAYFEDFFGDDTFREGTNRYVAGDWEQLIKITGSQEMPKAHAEIVKRYVW